MTVAPRDVASVIDALITREGGYVDHPADKGGPTCWGITEYVARAWGYTGPMDQLSRRAAAAIYSDRYWFQPRFDQVAALSPPVAEELLDTGVNMGTGTAACFLQRCLNVLNQQARLWPDLIVDRSVGRLTLLALRAYLQHRGGLGEQVLLRMLNGLQSARYIELAERDASQEAFEFGWQDHRIS